MNVRITPARRLLVLGVAAALLAAACSDDDGASTRPDDTAAPATVQVIGSETDSGSGSGSASAPAPESGSASGSGSGSASAPGAVADATPADRGYAYASNVDSHRLVVLDICDIAELLDADPIDFAAVETIYRDGVNSVRSDGTIRSTGEFAASEDRNHGIDEYYGTPTPLDDYVGSALDGTGAFNETSDGVRAQGVEKGIQNQVMVAWVVHELNAALAKAAEGDFDVAEGAVHNWDEGWAFYTGAAPGCAPYATADKRGGNFGTVGADGETSFANEAILQAMIDGRDALLAEDADGADAAAGEVLRNVVITYSQAAIRYATLVEDDVTAGDTTTGEEHRAEGQAFWRVIEAYVAPLGADVDAVNVIFAFDGELGAAGGGAEVRAALQPAWDELGIGAGDIGELS